MADRKQLAILHTNRMTVPGTLSLAREILPHTRIVNIVDDSLLEDVFAANGLTRQVTRRICQYVLAAQDGGADVIMNQCSSVGEAVDTARKLVDIPVLRMDEPMAREAVRRGPRIGVVATVATTLDPTCRLIDQIALSMGNAIEIQHVLAEGAFDILRAGDKARHNAMVLERIMAVKDSVDVIVLAQGSMAVLVPELESLGIPVLTSPRLGLLGVKKLLAQINTDERKKSYV